ncbi:MAG: signal peptidase II [Spirochaetales bacterium]|nr:signal peptidase II [Spirochaetales bacterium]
MEQAKLDIKKLQGKILPFSLTIAVFVIDQLSKAIIASQVKLYETIDVLGDFFRITHVRNRAMAFSIGKDLPGVMQFILFIILPPILIVGLFIFYFTSSMTKLQRWCIAGIIGGGLGNLFDRFFRPEGVVDFLDFKFYGLFGWERWPTFNIADSTVVVLGILLFLTLLFGGNKVKKEITQ